MIRLLGPITEVSTTALDGKPYTVRYKVVGTLNDQGWVEDLNQPAARTMTFWVAPIEKDSNKLRIDRIDGAPAPLILSDQALDNTMYKIQTIYFWDAANLRLIPDVRYVPQTQVRDKRADAVVQWLLDGPTPWLTGAQRLPAGTARRSNVVTVNGALVVDLTAQAGANGGDAIQRLYNQLRWSLRSLSDLPIDLRIDGKVPDQLNPQANYLPFNETEGLGSVSQRKFDIRDQKVVTVAPTDPALGVLATKDNANVVYAAVTRSLILAAFVRAGTGGDPRRSLQIIRNGGQSTVVSDRRSADMGRPAWIPGREVLVVPSGGRLWAVAASDGHSVDVTPSRMDNVRAMAISPDGRRIAIVAEGQTYVASLNIDDKGAVTIGSNPHALLSGELTAVAVAWDSEARLYVAGQSGGAAAMWQVTADGGLAQDRSPSLKGIVPTDVVAFAKSRVSLTGDVNVISGQTVFAFANDSPLTSESELRAPFFTT